jgi:bifunctional DNA-binding transcriptional regulator/antitoxin component of YhaV-PrlF toxin-antitoxin module
MAFVTDVKLAANGRMVLPQAVREAMGVSGETRIIVTVDGPNVRLSHQASGPLSRTCQGRC